MRTGETWILAALAVLLSGGVFTAVKAMPDMTEQSSEILPSEELSLYDQLKLEIQPYHFGNVPRESFSGDTTVWIVDLDCNMYSQAQANLHVTRVLRRLNFKDIVVRERVSGGMVFNAGFPNGQPFQIHFTAP